MTTVRNYIPGENLPWGPEDTGWEQAVFEPETVWVVFVDGKIEALLIGAQVMNTLLLIRLLSKGRTLWWLRPLWAAVRAASDNLNLVGFWSCMDNGREAEKKLTSLLKKAAKTTSTRDASGFWISGRF